MVVDLSVLSKLLRNSIKRMKWSSKNKNPRIIVGHQVQRDKAGKSKKEGTGSKQKRQERENYEASFEQHN